MKTIEIYLFCKHRQVCCGSFVYFRAPELASELCVCLCVIMIYSQKGEFDLF